MDLISFLPRAVMQGIPLLYGSTGEILTEKSGNLNLGIPGIMYVGGICGVIGAFFYEQSTPAASMNGLLAVGIPMLCSLLGSLLMGLLYCLLTVTLRANQNVTGLAMTTFGVGIGNFFGGSLIKLTGSEVPSIALSTTSAYFSKSLPFAAKCGWRCWPPTSSSTPVPDCISGPWVRAHPRRTPPASTSLSTSIWLPALAV